MNVSIKKILDELPLWPIVIISIIFGFMPFGEPHLVSKFIMLRDGVVLIPIDWFDIFVHAGPLVLAAFKIRREVQVRAQASIEPDAD